MGKLDVGVGDEFPVNEPEAPPSQSPNQSSGQSPDDEEAYRAAHEEWHRRRDEWREQRRAWKSEWRARKHAFRDDIRRSVHENFGPRSFDEHNHWVVRVLVGIGLVALAIAVLPFMFIFGIFVALIAVFAAKHGFSHHHYDDRPTAGGRRDRAQ